MPRIAFHPERLKRLTLPARSHTGAVGQVDYWDESQPAFGLRVTSNGTRTWMLMTRVLRAGQRKQVRVSVGRYADRPNTPGALSLAEARTKALRLAEAAASGQDPMAERQARQAAEAERSRNTFEAAVDLFLANGRSKRSRDWRPATRRQYESILRGPDLRGWADRPMASIARKDVRAVLDAALARGITVRANRILSSLHRFFEWALDREIVTANPTAGMAAPVAEQPRTRHLFGDPQTNRPGELVLAWRAFEQCGAVHGAYLRLLLLSGQRRDEVAQIRHDELFDLDGENPRWILPAHKAKNRQEHHVPLSPLQVQIIQSVPRIVDCPFLFSTNGRGPINGFSKLKIRADEAIAAVRTADPTRYTGQFHDPWTLHDLRRTFSTGLIELGVSEAVVDLLTNHISGEARRGVRRHYNHARREKEKREAMLIWERHILSLLAAEVTFLSYALAA